MSEATTPTQATESRSGVKVILIVIAVIVLLGLLACGGMMGLIYYGLYVGLPKMIESEVQSAQVIQDEIGDIESITMDFTDTAKNADPEGKKQIMSFNIEGSKGSGHLLVETSKTNSNEFNAITLVTSDGRELPVPLDGKPGATTLDTSDIDIGETGDVDAAPPAVEEADEPALSSGE